MTTINLKDFYAWYTHDEYIEVSDEVAAELRADKLYEAAYQRRVIRNKAQYSLDCDDGIEYSACLSNPTPQELLERMAEATCREEYTYQVGKITFIVTPVYMDEGEPMRDILLKLMLADLEPA